MAENAAKAGAEFLNRWREDLSDFIPLDLIESCTDFGIRERPPLPGLNYTGFVDAAGGTGSDSFTIAIAHREYDQVGTVKVDLLRERKPRFVPAAVVGEFAGLLRLYGVRQVQGDRFAGAFHSDEWARNGITFMPCDKSTAENYLHVLPILLSGRARLLDNTTLRTQLAGLERKVQAGSRETVTHAQVASAHDDVATSACGALVAAGDRLAYNTNYAQWV
jgi:hypothetical protein